MPPGRRIPRPPANRPRHPDPLPEESEIALPVAKAAGELSALWARIRACEACSRAAPERAYGTGFPRAPVMLVKESPAIDDLDSGNAFEADAGSLTKAFEALDIPMSWVYGSTAVRCGSDPASADQIAACSTHLLIEIEAVGPRVLIAFGPKAAGAIRALNGRCGLRIPDEMSQGSQVRVRSDLVVLVTEALPQGLTERDSKRRLWRDLHAVPALVGDSA